MKTSVVETIVAVATPPGRGGIGIIRVSGPLAYDIGLSITKSKQIKPRIATYRTFYDEDTVLDQGLILYFKAPHSFTGEDVIEFQGHGSPVVLNMLLASCVAKGARLARPGEFSERAFLNQRLDLTQAEAIADLIAATSKKAAHLSMQSLQGVFSQKIHALNEKIIYLRMYVEAAIDFPEEEIDFLNDGVVLQHLTTLFELFKSIRTSAFQGALIREGATVVIAGPPNAGKSTLMNALAENDIAIVTPIAGTTRDVMRCDIVVNDMPLKLVDTAGLRETDDLIEQEGIIRAQNEIKKADCVLWISDTEETFLTPLPMMVSHPELPIIHVINKIDLRGELPKVLNDHIYLSAQTGEGLDLLKETLKKVLGSIETEGHFIARQRHLDALNRAYAFLEKGWTALTTYQAGELLAEDLSSAHQALSTITGQFTTEDLLSEIFSSFCIGK